MAVQRRATRPPAKSPEARENQLVALATDLAEKQLREGTASSQTITHFLKLATSRNKLEEERLRQENLLLKARAEELSSRASSEQLYKDAIAAFASYAGNDVEDTYED